MSMPRPLGPHGPRARPATERSSRPAGCAGRPTRGHPRGRRQAAAGGSRLAAMDRDRESRPADRRRDHRGRGLEPVPRLGWRGASRSVDDRAAVAPAVPLVRLAASPVRRLARVRDHDDRPLDPRRSASRPRRDREHVRSRALGRAGLAERDARRDDRRRAARPAAHGRCREHPEGSGAVRRRVDPGDASARAARLDGGAAGAGARARAGARGEGRARRRRRACADRPRAARRAHPQHQRDGDPGPGRAGRARR